MKIGEVSKIAGFACSTLRYYEQINLIRDIKKDESGLRDYSEEDVQWIKFIASMKVTKLSIQDINLYGDLYYGKNEDFSARLAVTLECKEKLVKEKDIISQSIDSLKKKIEYYKSKIDNIK